MAEADAAAGAADVTVTTDAGAAAGAAAADAAKAGADDAAKVDAGAADAGKTDAGKADAAKAGDDKGDAAPVDYAKTIGEVKLPEGMALNPEAAKAAGELFGKHKLSPEAAKELVGLYAAQVKAGQEISAKAFSDTVKAWETASLADKEIGGKEGMALAKTAVTKFFDADTAKVLEHFGLMGHPGFIKSALKIGKAIKDDSFIPGDAGSGGGSDARKQFPNSNMNP